MVNPGCQVVDELLLELLKDVLQLFLLVLKFRIIILVLVVEPLFHSLAIVNVADHVRLDLRDVRLAIKVKILAQAKQICAHVLVNGFLKKQRYQGMVRETVLEEFAGLAVP